MLISNILKQNRANKELQERLNKNIESTATLLRAVNNDNSDAIDTYEEVNKIKPDEKRKLITFKYPVKTVKEADIQHHRRVHDAEVTFRQELSQWNDRLFTASQAETASRPIDGEADAQAVATPYKVRIAECKPTFIKPGESVVKIGDTHYELILEKELNPETRSYEWKRQDMEILERPEPNDVHMEDSIITFEDKEKTKIDWENTLKDLKEYGEQLGYSKRHFLRCLHRIMGQNNDDLFLTYKEEEDPEKIANSLLTKYLGVNKKKLFENKLKTLTRVKGQSIRDVMTQADILADRILQKCKDPQEKAFRKHQILLDALKSFCSEENAKELIQALKGSSLSGERADISELIDTIEIAEKVNENSKPMKDMVYMNDRTADKCEIFTMNTEKGKQTTSDGAAALEDTIQRARQLSLQGREERRRQNSQERNRNSQDQRAREDYSRKNTRDFARRSRDSSMQRSQSRERNDRHSNRDERHSNRDGRNWSRNSSNPRERLREQPNNDRTWNNRNRENRERRNTSRERDFSRERRDFSNDRRNNREWNRDNRNNETSRNNRDSESNRRRDSSYNRRDQSRPMSRERKDYKSRQWDRNDPPREQRNREWSRSRQENTSGSRQRGRDDSRNRSGGREGLRNRSQSRDFDRKRVPAHKRNLEGVEFPPRTQMDLTVKFCVKCHNTLEEHYPWDCKLYRYWSNSPCDICYNGQHRAKECRKNPNRVDAFTMMLENIHPTNNEKAPTNSSTSSFSPF